MSRSALPLWLAGLLVLGGQHHAQADILYYSNDNDVSTINTNVAGGNSHTFATLPTGNGPFGITFDRTGSGILYVVDGANGTIEKFNSSGSYIGTFTTPPTTQPRGIAFDGAGDAFVTTNHSGTDAHAVEKFDHNGNDLGAFATGLDFTRDLVHRATNLYVIYNSAYNSTGGIEKFSSNGTDLGTFGSSTLNNPRNLAFSSSGHLYVSVDGSVGGGTDKIKEYDSNGNFVGNLNIAGLDQPHGIAFDSAGNLFVANYGNSSDILKYTFDSPDSLTGTSSIAATTTNNPDFIVFAPVASVPEPGSFAQTAIASVIGIVICRTRRKETLKRSQPV